MLDVRFVPPHTSDFSSSATSLSVTATSPSISPLAKRKLNAQALRFRRSLAMSKFVPVEGISKKPKRASRACEHCRWKRLKCSDEKKDQSCMNCVIYGTKCTYATMSSPGGSGRRKQGQTSSGEVGKATSPSVTSSSTSSKKRQQIGSSSANSLGLQEGGERSSQSPNLMSVDSMDSPVSASLHDDLFLSSGSPGGMSGQALLPKMANARRIAAEWTKTANPKVDPDSIGNRLDQYAHFLTTFGTEASGESSEILSEETGLPPQQIANALLKAYTDGFQAGSMATQVKLKSLVTNQHLDLLPSTSGPLSSSTAIAGGGSPHSQSRQDYATSPIEQPHDLSLTTLFDPLSSHPHHQHQTARLAAAGLSPASSVSSFTGQMDLGIRDHHHQQQMQAQQRQRQQQAQQQSNQGHHDQYVQAAPRSVPHHLSLAIPHQHNVPQPGDPPTGHHQQGHHGHQRQHQHQGWPQGGPNSAPPGMMHPGFEGNPFGML